MGNRLGLLGLDDLLNSEKGRSVQLPSNLKQKKTGVIVLEV
jgi:hypothetical protein